MALARSCTASRLYPQGPLTHLAGARTSVLYWGLLITGGGSQDTSVGHVPEPGLVVQPPCTAVSSAPRIRIVSLFNASVLLNFFTGISLLLLYWA